MVEKSQWHVTTAGDEVIADNDSIEMTSDEQYTYHKCPVDHEWVTPVNGVHVPYVHKNHASVLIPTLTLSGSVIWFLLKTFFHCKKESFLYFQLIIKLTFNKSFLDDMQYSSRNFSSARTYFIKPILLKISPANQADWHNWHIYSY